MYKTNTIFRTITAILAIQDIILGSVSNVLCLSALVKFLTAIGVIINTEYLNMVMYKAALTNEDSENHMLLQTFKLFVKPFLTSSIEVNTSTRPNRQ